MLSAIISILTSLPSILKLVEKLIAIYEGGVKRNEDKLLEKADDDVTQFVRRVQASNGVRDSGVAGVSTTNAASADNKCNCSGPGLCDRCAKDSEPIGISDKDNNQQMNLPLS